MPNRPPDLPDFENPPVTEVVLSLQFGTLAKLKSAYIGFLWSKFRDRYPIVTEHGPIDPAFETFGAPSPNQPMIRFEQFASPPFPRYWFESRDGSGLCQVQQDRLIHNWRRRAAPYPRYEAIRAELVQDVETFQDFLATEELGELRFNQTEVSYINTIDLPGGDDPHNALEQVLSVWRRLDSAERDLEDVFFRARYIMKKGGEPHARMHVTATPAVRRSTLDPVVQLEITFRGRPDDDGLIAALQLMDEGRIAIVKTFTEVTTSEMHRHWGRKDVRQ